MKEKMIEGFRLSPQQRHTWSLQQAHQDGAYRAQCAITVEGDIDLDNLERALQQVVKRHEILRTRFVLTSRHKEPLQVISDDDALLIEQCELSSEDPRETHEQIARLFNQQGQRHFYPEQDLPLRISMVTLSPSKRILLITLNSLCADAASLGVLTRDISYCYEAVTRGEEPNGQAAQYADLSEWLNDLATSSETQEGSEYWRKQDLSDLFAFGIPFQKQVKESDEFEPEYLSLEISPELKKKVQELAQRSRTSPAVVLLAAWQTLLWRLSEYSNVTIGVAHDGRKYKQLNNSVGLLTRFVPLQAQIKDLPFTELLKQTYKLNSDCRTWQEYFNWEEIKDGIPSAPRHCYFPFSFGYEDRRNRHNSDSVLFSTYKQYSCFDRFKLKLTCAESEGRLITEFHYDSLIFGSDDVKRLASQFHTLLENAVANPEAILTGLEILSDSERDKVLFELNDTTVDYTTRMACLHTLFERQAERTPARVAAEYEGRQLTYAELNRRANQLAHYLQRLGVEPEGVVGICVERSLEMLIGVIAILKAGAAYVPLDPEYPKQRLRFFLQDSGIKILLSQHRLVEALSQHDLEIVYLDEDWQTIATESEENPQSGVHCDNLAYLIYTSGSTGKPKAAMNTHRGVSNRQLWMQDYYGLSENDRVLQLSSFSFDFSVWEMFGPLSVGAAVIFPAPGGQHDTEYLAKLIVSSRVSLVHFVPSMLRVFLEEKYLNLGGSLKKVFVGGEALTSELQESFFDSMASTLHNQYGPTEASIDVTYWDCRQGTKERTVPIGRPTANNRIYILDRLMRPVPLGVSGELYIGGIAVGRGYYNGQEMTAEKFIPNPYASTAAERLYRTGDLGRHLPDGNIEFIGRIDHQVKIRGFRIELGEIEAALADLPFVTATAVLAREDKPGDKRLVAYLVLSDHSVSISDIRSLLLNSLPDYMIPSAFVRLDSLPLTHNGKLDRKALPAPEASSSDDLKAFVAPRNPVEETLCSIWCDVLGVDLVGIHDNFFNLGGDSIISIQIVSRARRAGINISPKLIFQHQSIAALASAASPFSELPDDLLTVSGPARLSPIQLAFFDHHSSSPHHYNQSLLLQVNHYLHSSALAAAVEALLVHHDALRLRFSLSDTGWQQSLLAPHDIGVFSSIDLSDLASSLVTAAVESACDMLQRSLNISDGPIIRVALLLLPDASSRLLIVIHHLAVDAVSWHILLDDLQQAYSDFLVARPPALAAKTTSFKRWSEALFDFAQSDLLKQQLPYWLGVTDPQGISPLPVDYTDADNTVSTTEGVQVSLSQQQTKALLQQVPKAYHTHIDEVMLTALATTLSRWTAGEMLVDVEGHGREAIIESADVTRTVGWFTSIYPVRMNLINELSAADAIKQVKQQIRTIPDAGVGYSILKYLTQDQELREQLRGGAKAEVSFNYLGQFDQAIGDKSMFKAAEESYGRARSESGLREYLLEINCYVVSGKLVMNWTFSKAVHNRETIEQLASSFISDLERLIDHCLDPDAGGYTPCDFPLAHITQSELDLIALSYPHIQDLYPLSPMQQGMLFHALHDSSSGIYNEQSCCSLEGVIDIPAFTSAWQHLIDRHSILRTAFIWQQLSSPLQILLDHVPVELTLMDWRHLDQLDLASHLSSLLEADRLKGFDFSAPPLMRLTLIQTSEHSYEFIWTHHHILLDGWSVSLLLKDLFLFYEARVAGNPSSLPDAIPYSSYISWLSSNDDLAAESYWRATLEGFSRPSLIAPPQPNSSISEMSSIEQTLPQELTQRLQQVARKHQLTMNTIVQGMWGLLLSRYSGQQDVVFGATVSGRPAELEGVEQMVGLFINTLPVRVKVDGQARVMEWLQRLQEQQVEARQYEYSRLVDVQGWSEVPRGEALFDNIVVFENYPVDASVAAQATSLGIKRVFQIDRANFPLGISAALAGDSLHFRINYDVGCFDVAAVKRMLRHLESILAAFSDPDSKQLHEVDLLTEVEAEQILVQWNDTHRDIPLDKTIHELFENLVDMIPDRVAVACEGGQITFSELNRRSNQLANYLRRMGVGPDVRVGVCVERSPDTIVGLFGILKAGGAFVPLDPDYPIDRLDFMITDAEISVLLTQESLQDCLPTSWAQVIRIDADADRISQESFLNIARSSAPQNIAYIIYTSGSTGRPKGVMISQSSLCHLVEAIAQGVQIRSEDKVLQFASLSYDASVYEIFPTLLAGSTLWLASPEMIYEGDTLLRSIQEKQISIATMPPSVVAMLPDGDPDSLRTLVVAGEACTLDIVKRYGVRRRFLNAYGPTETTVCATIGEVHHHNSVPPIGRPVANTQTYILDGTLRAVPVGIDGELFVSGYGVARGYINRPDLTAEKFIPDPFSESPGERMYRTGDLAKHLPDGNIEFIGRIDHQVKIRGFRIELGEIEAALADLPFVIAAAVLAREDKPGDKRLVAYLVLSDHSVSISDIRSLLLNSLPDYMIPSSFIRMEALPLTHNGKLDRKALPAPDSSSPHHQKAFVAARNPVEETLCSIWSDVLGVDLVGIHDNFFDLGGHSLLATLVISRMRQTFQVDIPFRSLFEEPSVADLALLVDGLIRGGLTLEEPPLIAASRDRELPLSFAQQRLWFIEQFDPGTATYNIPIIIRFKGKLRVEALEQSLSAIVSRHEILRTSFSVIDDLPVQLVAPPRHLRFPIIDLEGLSEAVRQEEMMRLIDIEAQKGFDLNEGPPFRLALLRLSETDYVGIFVMHHIISDGWSIGILAKEMTLLYRAFSDGAASTLPLLPMQYADFSVWQQEWMQGEVLKKHLVYWEDRLQNLPNLKLATATSESEGEHHQAGTQRLAISEEDSLRLKELSKQEDATLFMTLLAAFKVLLYSFTHQEDIAVGTDIANRDRVETENLIGFFVNQLVLRTDLSGNPSFRELLRRVREVTIGAYAYQNMPFELLVKTLNPERELSRTPLFQVKFALNNAPSESMEIPGLDMQVVEAQTGTAKLDLMLNMVDTRNGLAGQLDYSKSVFNADLVSRIAEHFEILTSNVTKHPDMTLQELTKVLTEADRVKKRAKQTELKEIKNKKLAGIKPRSTKQSKALEV